MQRDLLDILRPISIDAMRLGAFVVNGTIERLFRLSRSYARAPLLGTDMYHCRFDENDVQTHEMYALRHSVACQQSPDEITSAVQVQGRTPVRATYGRHYEQCKVISSIIVHACRWRWLIEWWNAMRECRHVTGRRVSAANQPVVK